jgi:hypothetical protein
MSPKLPLVFAVHRNGTQTASFLSAPDLDGCAIPRNPNTNWCRMACPSTECQWYTMIVKYDEPFDNDKPPTRWQTRHRPATLPVVEVQLQWNLDISVEKLQASRLCLAKHSSICVACVAKSCRNQLLVLAGSVICLRHMEVSLNGGTSKSSILIKCSSM